MSGGLAEPTHVFAMPLSKESSKRCRRRKAERPRLPAETEGAELRRLGKDLPDTENRRPVEGCFSFYLRDGLFAERSLRCW